MLSPLLQLAWAPAICIFSISQFQRIFHSASSPLLLTDDHDYDLPQNLYNDDECDLKLSCFLLSSDAYFEAWKTLQLKICERLIYSAVNILPELLSIFIFSNSSIITGPNTLEVNS